jgi:hypothetical protein
MNMISWSVGKDQTSLYGLKQFDETATVEKGKTKYQVIEVYNHDKNVTLIHIDNHEKWKKWKHNGDNVIKKGFVFLRLLTHGDTLVIGTS